MQKQTSALQRLSKILNDAVLNSSGLSCADKPVIPILLRYIDSSDDSPHLMDFFTELTSVRVKQQGVKPIQDKALVF